MKKFDLNIEKVLEDWEIYHAIREVIANALDEQVLTGTKDIQIFQDETGRWHIRDFGRGLKYEHLTQKENEEKLQNKRLIGKFGVGLKDALATFDRRNVKVLIKSLHGDIALGKAQKYSFEDIITLHAEISQPSDMNMVGTEFILESCKDEDIEKAKNLFLIFSGEKILEKTKYGDVLEKNGEIAKIYIKGVKVSEEEDFLFSYNITSLTNAMEKALNRERTNVGRTAYFDRIKQILLACKGNDIKERLANDLIENQNGSLHGELNNWSEVYSHACKLLSSHEKVIFSTPNDLTDKADTVDEAKNGGFKIITVPENIRKKISGKKDFSGNLIRDFDEFEKDRNNSFKFNFVDPNSLKPEERNVFDKTEKLLQLIGGTENVKDIKISETMTIKNSGFSEAGGLWDKNIGRIIIKRTELKSIEKYAGTLLHEIAHAISGADDVTRDFEQQLTSIMGIIASKSLK
jgi:hypothetical protein